MAELILAIDIEGEVDQPGLDRLRTQLNLTKEGRFSDDWDQEFGYRIVDTASGQPINIGIFREFDNSWTVNVFSNTFDIAGSDLTLLRTELTEGIASAGYHAIPRDRPTYGPRQS